jgi:hypothetical protein
MCHFLEYNHSHGWESLPGIIDIREADCTTVVSKQVETLNPQVGIQYASTQIQLNRKILLKQENCSVMIPPVTCNFAKMHANYTNCYTQYLWKLVGTLEWPEILRPFSVLTTDLIHILLLSLL